MARNDAVENAVWKTLEESAANIFSDHRETFWIFGNRIDRLINGFEEFRS